MAKETSETITDPSSKAGNGWKGILFNLCFIIYYYFTYHWVINESEIVNSYGLSSTILFSKTLGWVVLISLIAEPFAIFYKLNYENYNIKRPALSLPKFFLVIMFISRFFVRIVFFIAALESAGIEVENGGAGATVVGAFIFISELVFAFTITDKEFVGKIRPTILREVFTRFVLLNMLVLFAFLFNLLFTPLLKEEGQHVLWMLTIGFLLFTSIYLPNTMLQFYSDWRASKTVLQKALYILSFFVAFLSIILFG